MDPAFFIQDAELESLLHPLEGFLVLISHLGEVFRENEPFERLADQFLGFETGQLF
jgi:hypothetical protein